MDELKKENTESTFGSETFNPQKAKTGGIKLFWKILGAAAVFFILIFLLFSCRGPIFEQTNSFLDKIPLLNQLRHLVNSSDRLLKDEQTGRINILLLGIGGKNHDGPYLTDTIMLASLDVKDKKIALLSIPRDLSIPVENTANWTKINEIDAYAEAKTPGSGGVAVSEAVADILNVPVDYYVRVDFDAFKDVIDKIGGIDVDVENTLDDYSYPIDGQEDNPDYNARFTHLHLDKGWQHLDGTLALEYARSRHGAGVEGSDFARARRQQLVLQAVKDKLLSANILLNPVLVGQIVSELADHISTNLQIWEIIKAWTMFKDVSRDSIITKVLDNSADGLLYQTINDQGAYVLLPKNGDFSEIQYLARNIFTEVPPQTKETVATEQASLEILNGTWINGLANRAAVDIDKYGFKVIAVANSSRQNFTASIIYDLTMGQKINALSVLKAKTGATVTFDLPDWLKADLSAELTKNPGQEKPDFVLVLGQDADTTNSGTANTQ
ncbi:MAG TPA: LCP family protein [Candidatus Nanoarchaeia archaeon]|nr:LCP family protein [Candidatus Nanoarchaeia archaeon]